MHAVLVPCCHAGNSSAMHNATPWEHPFAYLGVCLVKQGAHILPEGIVEGCWYGPTQVSFSQHAMDVLSLHSNSNQTHQHQHISNSVRDDTGSSSISALAAASARRNSIRGDTVSSSSSTLAPAPGATPAAIASAHWHQHQGRHQQQQQQVYNSIRMAYAPASASAPACAQATAVASLK